MNDKKKNNKHKVSKIDREINQIKDAQLAFLIANGVVIKKIHTISRIVKENKYKIDEEKIKNKRWKSCIIHSKRVLKQMEDLKRAQVDPDPDKCKEGNLLELRYNGKGHSIVIVDSTTETSAMREMGIRILKKYKTEEPQEVASVKE